MIPLSLLIENFMCYESAHLDFTKFSSALIIGRVEGNDLYSNNVGKTTVFKAIEYALFNKSSFNLELLIRDNTDFCRVSFEFLSDKTKYKIVRTRTKKGANDLKILKFSESSESWEDISCRRVADSEEFLAELIKINYSSFRSTVHFVQNDFSGLATATPEKRKSLLKEALQLSIYSKLEKMAKDKYSSLQKQFDSTSILISALGDPLTDIARLNSNLGNINTELLNKNKQLSDLKASVSESSDFVNVLEKDLFSKEKSVSTLINSKNSIDKEIELGEKKKSSLLVKKDELLASSKKMIANVAQLKEDVKLFTDKDLVSELSGFNKELANANDLISQITVKSNFFNDKLTQLKQPLPKDNFCSHCKQKLTEDHRQACKDEAEKAIATLLEDLSKLNNDKKELYLKKEQLEKSIKNTNECINKLNSINNQIANQSSIIENNKGIFSEYKQLIEKEQSALLANKEKLNELIVELSKSDITAIETLKASLKVKKDELNSLNKKLDTLNSEFNKLSSEKAVIEHSISSKEKDLVKIAELTESKAKINEEIAYYPEVIESFGSSGITNLIIQNVLDDLQSESNNLLSLLKPGVQLSFVIEKTKSNGMQDDTLDILYYVNGKQRDFEQISGATKIAVQFALKLGLFSILQKILGLDLRLLLLDEVDQPLDKAGIDALSDIIKFFQKDFNILVITHNDRLKDKFQHFVVVEQDREMVSTIIQQDS